MMFPLSSAGFVSPIINSMSAIKPGMKVQQNKRYKIPNPVLPA